MNNQGGKRGRHRNSGGGRRGGNPGRQNFDSNGPGVRIRGNASQIHDKYVQLARDAQGNGDHVLAESMLQHAEHYYRILNADQPDRPTRHQAAPQDRYRGRPAPEETEEETDSSEDESAPEADAAEAVVESLSPPASGAAAEDDGEAEREAERERERRGRPRRDPRTDRRRMSSRRGDDNDGEGRDALARMLGTPASEETEATAEPEAEERKPRRGRPRKNPEGESSTSQPRRRTTRPRRFEASEGSPELPLSGDGQSDTVGAE